MPGVASSGLPGAAAGPSSGLLPGSSLTPRPSCIVAIGKTPTTRFIRPNLDELHSYCESTNLTEAFNRIMLASFACLDTELMWPNVAVADVTSLGCTGPEMSYLVETAVAPAIKTLGLTFSISTPSSQYARFVTLSIRFLTGLLVRRTALPRRWTPSHAPEHRYIVIETGGYTGASGFVTRQGRSTCDVSRTIASLCFDVFHSRPSVVGGCSYQQTSEFA